MYGSLNPISTVRTFLLRDYSAVTVHNTVSHITPVSVDQVLHYQKIINTLDSIPSSSARELIIPIVNIWYLSTNYI